MNGDGFRCGLDREGNRGALGVTHGSQVRANVVAFGAALTKRRKRVTGGDDFTGILLRPRFSALIGDVAVEVG